MHSIPRAVIDTNVWVKIFLHEVVEMQPKRPFSQILDALHGKEFIPVYCYETRWELDYMLKYGKDVGRKYNVDPADADDFIAYVFDEHGGLEVEITNALHVIPDDEDDDMFVEAAVEGAAEYLVSEDQHFRDDAFVVRNYLNQRKIQLLYASQFLTLLDSFQNRREREGV